MNAAAGKPVLDAALEDDPPRFREADVEPVGARVADAEEPQLPGGPERGEYGASDSDLVHRVAAAPRHEAPESSGVRSAPSTRSASRARGLARSSMRSVLE